MLNLRQRVDRLTDYDARVLLDYMKPADAPLLFSYTQDPEIYDFMPWSAPASVEESRELIAELSRRAELNLSCDFAIRRKEDMLFMGVISLADINFRYAHAEIGYWLARNFWGNGYMYEAQVLIMNFALDELGLHRLTARISPRNKRSIKTIERLGFKFEGTMRDEAFWKGEFHTHNLYSFLSTDYRPKLKP